MDERISQMKRIWLIIGLFIAIIFGFSFKQDKISAKEILISKQVETLTGNKLGAIEIYNNGEIVIRYKYGLRKADLFYCEKETTCLDGMDSVMSILESNSVDTYKNTSEDLKSYTFQPDLDSNKLYRFRVEAYFGKTSGYTGTEGLYGSPTITSLQVLETKDNYVNYEKKYTYGDEGIDNLMTKIQNIVNTVIIPVLYTAIGMVLVVKGSILGVEIVKSADDPNTRAQKVHSLKWLAIGTGIAFAASTLVGIVTGFFTNAFK